MSRLPNHLTVDPLIRAELVEQMPMLCMQVAPKSELSHRVDEITPLLARYLNDNNTQVHVLCLSPPLSVPPSLSRLFSSVPSLLGSTVGS